MVKDWLSEEKKQEIELKKVWNDERECSSCWVRHSDDWGIGEAVLLF